MAGHEAPAHEASMLLGFRAENVRSFRDELSLSLLATAMAERYVRRPVHWREGGKPIDVLPAAGIYGANASGKSNVLRALYDMRTFVLHSFRSGRPTGGLPQRPFRLDPATSEKPSRFAIDIVLCGVRHEYGFTVDREKVLDEWAVKYPKGRAVLLFSREGDDVHLGTANRGKSRAVLELLRPNALFLSTAASANHPALLPLYGWFERNLLLAEAHSRQSRQALTTTMLDDEDARDDVLTFLKAADLGITGAVKKPIDPKVRDRLERAVKILVGEENESSEGSDVGPNFDDTFGIRLLHQGSEGEVEFDPADESLGTLVWFGLVGPVIRALRDGSVFLADELDASLHPVLVAHLIALFQDPRSNPRRAQLVFNSHDTTVLGEMTVDRLIEGDGRLLGRDQVWFTEKANDGATRLYPLSDLEPRKGEAIERRYLRGRYGATPIVARPRVYDDSRVLTANGQEG